MSKEWLYYMYSTGELIITSQITTSNIKHYLYCQVKRQANLDKCEVVKNQGCIVISQVVKVDREKTIMCLTGAAMPLTVR